MDQSLWWMIELVGPVVLLLLLVFLVFLRRSTGTERATAGASRHGYDEDDEELRDEGLDER